MKQKSINMFMDIAHTVAQQSHGIRKKVGAIIVNDDRILSIGYNGTLPGHSNELEYKVYAYQDAEHNCERDDTEYSYRDADGDYRLVTKPDVIHAEMNALIKLARDGQPSKGSTLFCTLSPCVNCTQFIIGAGIKEVFFSESYRDSDALDLLAQHGINYIKVDYAKN